MCVIAICEKNVRPSLVQRRQMWDANKDGAGIAWVSKAKRGGVRFIKGLMTFEEFEAAYATVPVDVEAVLHFRISTVGGTSRALTHPFVVSEKSPLALTGRVPGVWFHNGHWSEWESALLQSTLSTPGGSVPEGRLSDSRAMAVLAARHSERIGLLIPRSQRTVFLSKDGAIYNGDGWSRVAADEGGGELVVSNRSWMTRAWGPYSSPVPRMLKRASVSSALPEVYRPRFNDDRDDMPDYETVVDGVDDIAELVERVQAQSHVRVSRGTFLTEEAEQVQLALTARPKGGHK